MRIGFIGLGIMGKPMARNLLKAGHELTVYDVVQANMDEVVSAGAAAVASGMEVARRSDVVITMLPNSPHVRQAVTCEDGILAGARPGLWYVDMSSIAPGMSQEISTLCAQKGVRMVDAPVSGGEPKAVDGTLAIMAGGDREVFDALKDDVLLKMGSSAVYCGAIGAGNTVKLANQVIVALNIAACAEALTLAKMAGVDPQVVFDAIKNGLAGSTVLNAKAPMMMHGDFRPGFRINLHIKDLTNALKTAHALGAPMPLSASVMEMMQNLRADGRGDEDHSSLANYYAKLSNTPIG